MKTAFLLVLILLVTFFSTTAMAQEKYIALTFDDGPNQTTTNQVLDKLEQYGVRATFFVIGNNITPITKPAMQRAYKLGNEIASHGFTHTDMTGMTKEQMTDELTKTSDLIEAAIGEKPRFFRPPFIAVNQLMHDAIELPFICGVGANDWEASVDAKARAEAILGQAKDGTIILLHDFSGNDMTVEALDTIIPQLLQQGYTFVTVSELFELGKVNPKEGFVYSNVYQKSAWQ